MKKMIVLLGLIVLCFSALVVDGQETALDFGFYDDTSPLLDYSGTWSELTCTMPCAYYGTHSWTQQFLADLTFSFFGTEITIFYTRYNNAGDAEICVNATCYFPFSMYSPTFVYRASITLTGFVSPVCPDCENHFTMRKANNNAEYINIDGVMVTGYPVLPTQEVVINVTVVMPETTPEPTPAWLSGYTLTDPDGNEQSAVLDYSVRVGEIVIAVLAFAILFTLLIGYAFSHSRRK